MSLVKRFIDWFQVWYGWKDLPDLEDIPPSGHGEWVRHPACKCNFDPEQPQQLEPNVQPPAVQIQPVQIMSARERAQFHKMRLELLPSDWLNSKPVDTEPIHISEIKTQPTERDTDATLHAPAISKLLHERQK